ncbi:hypothetical protein, partial [Burkholderia multivorans]|uniref:hypothetical protein n=1 Tax=Burkholderia multivorans TaxID=87883 RepID=UPI001C6558D0
MGATRPGRGRRDLVEEEDEAALDPHGTALRVDDDAGLVDGADDTEGIGGRMRVTRDERIAHHHSSA